MRKHFLYLSNDHLVAVLWQRGQGVAERSFSHADESVAAFADYISNLSTIPTYLLTDLIEEDFRVEAVPHVGLRDRKSLLERKLQQLYRTSPYRLAHTLGRLTDGRRDDEVLFCSLTNTEAIQRWVDVLLKAKVPIAGVYSVALLTEPLLKELQVKAKHVLWVSWQANAGWRQTYCQDTRVRFSRLTPISSWQAPQYVLADQIGKTLRYLESIGSLSSDEMLEVHVLSDRNQQAALQTSLVDEGQTRFIFHDLAQLSPRISKEAIARADVEATPLYVRVLDKSTNRVQFAPVEQRRYDIVRRYRIGILAASVALSVGGVAWGGWNYLVAQSLRANINQLQEATQSYQQLRAQTVAAFPRSRVNAQTMNEVVTYYDKVVRQSPSFTQFAEMLSQVLVDFPTLRLERLVWGSNSKANVDLDYAPDYSPGEANAAGADTSNNIEAAPSSGYYQSAILEASVAPFDGNYRAALREIERLSARLGNAGMQVATLALPLDTRAQNNLKGSATPQQPISEAKFALRLTRRPGQTP